MATLDHVEAELALRARWMIRLSQGRFWVSSGYRSPLEQIALYRLYISNPRKYPTAAVPGSSKHERNPAEAVDIACQSKDNGLRKDLAKHCGLWTPVKGEPWHHELDPNRSPLPQDQEEVRMIAIEPVGSVSHPHQGGWIWGRQGHVYAFEGAQHYGGWAPDQAGPTNRSGRDCIALVPTLTGSGYWLVSDAGEVYAYGEAKWTGNYRSEWGPGLIIGAYRNDRMPSPGGLTLIRDDGQNLNTYHLPAA